MSLLPETSATSASTRRKVVLAGAAVLPLAVAGLAAAQMDKVKTLADEAVHGGKVQPSAGLKEAAELGLFSKKASEAMATKASDPALQKFAPLEAEEQKTISEIMMANVQMDAPELSNEHQQLLDRMKGMSAGEDLDGMYLDAELKGHRKLKELHTQMSASGELTKVPVATSTLAICGIDSHLAMLEMIQQRMG